MYALGPLDLRELAAMLGPDFEDPLKDHPRIDAAAACSKCGTQGQWHVHHHQPVAILADVSVSEQLALVARAV